MKGSQYIGALTLTTIFVGPNNKYMCVMYKSMLFYKTLGCYLLNAVSKLASFLSLLTGHFPPCYIRASDSSLREFVRCTNIVIIMSMKTLMLVIMIHGPRDNSLCWTHLGSDRKLIFSYSDVLKRYKNYKNRLRLAKVVVKNKMSRFYGSVCILRVFITTMQLSVVSVCIGVARILSGSARFSSKKVDLFCSSPSRGLKLLNQPLPPPNLPKNVLKIDSCSAWVHLPIFPVNYA